LPNERRRRETGAPRRIQFIIAYDGGGFSGWQSQADGNGIQDHIETALAKIVGKKIRIHGAGRTDAGVHALGQCAHADLVTQLAPGTLRAALNASLPPTIRIMRCRFVAPSFHARFSACGKVYRYRIATGPVLSPFEIGRAWHLSAPLDQARLRECAETFAGEHDFAGFAANRGKPLESSIRTIRMVRVRRKSQITTIEFSGDGFLYKMVRLMVGATVQCALGRISVAEIRERLAEGKSPSQRLVAPAAGLTLRRVQYSSHH
jgi:tRNA pseudouridine38-40 synthase